MNAEGGIFYFELCFPHFFTLNFVFIYQDGGTITCLLCTGSGSHTTCESDKSSQTLVSLATSQVFPGTLPNIPSLVPLCSRARATLTPVYVGVKGAPKLQLTLTPAAGLEIKR